MRVASGPGHLGLGWLHSLCRGDTERQEECGRCLLPSGLLQPSARSGFLGELPPTLPIPDVLGHKPGVDSGTGEPPPVPALLASHCCGSRDLSSQSWVSQGSRRRRKQAAGPQDLLPPRLHMSFQISSKPKDLRWSQCRRRAPARQPQTPSSQILLPPQLHMK